MDLFPIIFGAVVVLGGAAVFIWWRRQYGVDRKDDRISQPKPPRDPYNRNP